jgi:uncharacterized DUF497 family protein
MSDFEFDQAKSLANLNKHGVDFIDAQAIWQDPNLIEIKANSEDEPRSLVIGKLKGKHWSAIITFRETSIRIISVRRSRHSEEVIYES